PAVEQHRRGAGGAGRIRLPAQERGEVARDGRVARVRQAELLQAGAALALWAIAERAARKEPVDQRRLDVSALHLRPQRPADHLAAAAENGDRQRWLAAGAEQPLLRVATARH